MGITKNGLMTDAKEWLMHPVNSDMDILDVVLTTILVVTVAFLWTRVLAQITD